MTKPSATYYEPDSRVQLLDKLCHLALFSDFLVLVTGEKGAGKTTLFSSLNGYLKADSGITLELALSSPTDVSGLLIDLAEQVPEHAMSGNDAEKLASLNALLQVARKQGQRTVISIDNADELMDDALELLLNLQFNDDNDDGASPQVVMFGDGSLVSRLEKSGWITALSGRLHAEHLKAYTEQEFNRYLEHRGVQVDAKQAGKLFNQTNGYPGRLPADLLPDSATMMSLQNAAPSQLAERPKTSKRALPFSTFLSVLVGAFLVAVLGVSAWFFLPQETQPVVSVDDSDTPINLSLVKGKSENTPTTVASSEQSEISKRLAEQEHKLREERPNQLALETENPRDSELDNTAGSVDITEERPLSVVKPQVVLSDESTNEKRIDGLGALPNVLPVEPVSLVVNIPAVAADPALVTEDVNAKGVPEAEPPVVKIAPPAVTPNTEEKTLADESTVIQPVNVVSELEVVANKGVAENNSNEPSFITEGEKELLAWPSGGYSLQMIGAREVSSLERFYKQYGKEGYHAFSTDFKGRPFYVIVYGQYETRKKAAEAVVTLPEAAQKLKPWARTVKGIQNDIRK